jgi:hypothetical protein
VNGFSALSVAREDVSGIGESEAVTMPAESSELINVDRMMMMKVVAKAPKVSRSILLAKDDNDDNTANARGSEGNGESDGEVDVDVRSSR